MGKKSMTDKVYFAEFNRSRNDNIRLTARRLEHQGMDVTVIPHKTSLKIVRPADMAWSDFTRAISAELKPRLGSVMVHSQSTGNTFLCSEKGNRPRRFQRV